MTKDNIGNQYYRIKEDECLFGMYINNAVKPSGRLFNEIANKRDSNYIEISGDYDVTWYEEKGIKLSGILRISPEGNMYKFKWCGYETKNMKTDKEIIDNLDNNKDLSFEGIGLKCGKNHIAISYWDFNS